MCLFVLDITVAGAVGAVATAVGMAVAAVAVAAASASVPVAATAAVTRGGRDHKHRCGQRLPDFVGPALGQILHGLSHGDEVMERLCFRGFDVNAKEAASEEAEPVERCLKKRALPSLWSRVSRIVTRDEF